MRSISPAPSMRPIIGGIDMVRASTTTMEKNSSRVPRPQAATDADPNPATRAVASIADTGGISWLTWPVP